MITGVAVLTRTDDTGDPFLAGPIGLGSSKATVQFDDVLVTDTGYRLLGPPIPKSIDEVQELASD